MNMANKSPHQITRITRYLSEPKHAIHFLRKANIADIAEIREVTSGTDKGDKGDVRAESALSNNQFMTIIGHAKISQIRCARYFAPCHRTGDRAEKDIL